MQLLRSLRASWRIIALGSVVILPRGLALSAEPARPAKARTADEVSPHGLGVRVPALDLLLGGQPADKPELARLASPVFHVDEKDPPLLLLHGDQDNQAPVNQSLEMQGKYEQHKRRVGLVIVHGAGHGGNEFYAAEPMSRVESSLAEHGRSAKER